MGKHIIFLWYIEAELVEQKRLLDGNKLIKKYFLFVFIFCASPALSGSADGVRQRRDGVAVRERED